MAAASFVRPGAVFADIGTDHAYLPVFLAERGIIKKAVAADINRGPIERAESNIRAAGLSCVIDTVQTDGLTGIEAFAPTDIAICGMGGELIARIVDCADFTKNENIRLILQPMTKAEVLREYLTQNGFKIVDETLAKEDKVYQIICAEYRGETEKYTDAELYLGRCNIEKGGELLFELAAGVIAFFKKKKEGKTKAGLDTSDEDRIIAEIKRKMQIEV